MKFEEAFTILREGRKVKSRDRMFDSLEDLSEYLNILNKRGILRNFNMEWELYEEPVKTYSFMEMIPLLKEGKKFKRPIWGDYFLGYSHSFYLQGKNVPCDASPFNMENIEANDWLEVEE